ncbi:hypothetical protein [Barrientosiimonas endolithica]|nr:hypothetical protein [Barrientosiimonas endolithica]
MTIKAWHIDKDWQETFVAALGKRGRRRRPSTTRSRWSTTR